MKYIVEYTLPYTHVVRVGIEAETPAAAEAKAEELFNRATLWDDTPDQPMLYDDYEEQDGVLIFSAIAEVDTWPPPNASLLYHRQRDAAMDAVRLLVDAFVQGDLADSEPDWETLNCAHRAALLALNFTPPREQHD